MTRARPVLQALLHAETGHHVSVVFQFLADSWAGSRPDAPPLVELVKQVHKDYSEAIETARRTVFPRSRPVNDFFHLRQKEKTIASKCS